MEQLLKYKLVVVFSFPLIIVFIIIFLIMAVSGSVLSTPELAITNLFSKPFSNETTYVITSKYGERLDPITSEESFHTGIDLGVVEGTEILSSYEGKVIKTGYEENGLGEYVKIEHNLENQKYLTVYGHLKKDSTVVKVDDYVEQNTLIALSGNTGKSTGPHLHYEIHLLKKDGSLDRRIDPINIFSE
ncbi:MAG: M23 family metallopeptidase [Clostridia bacterium]|nr:M23 family metallopeptidase [Clostridia bacterium]